jgi:hypothetical protein
VNPVYQQNVVTLYNAQYSGSVNPVLGSTPVTQLHTGQCVSGSSYWDIGVRGDLGPADHSGLITLNPTHSDITSTAGYASSNFSAPPGFTRQYCDGARQPPESQASGWNVPPGISDATVPNPIFNLTPVATVDEGNNWINLRWGPLSLVAPVANGTLAAGGLLSNYAPLAGSDNIPASTITPYPTAARDFNGNLRPEAGDTNGRIDAGAIEVRAGAGAPTPFAIRLPVLSPAQANAQGSGNPLGNAQGNAQ